MKQKHRLGFTTHTLFSEWSDVKCVLAAGSLIHRRRWIYLFHWCTEMLIHLSVPVGFPFIADPNLLILVLTMCPTCPALVGLTWSSQRGSATSEHSFWCAPPKEQSWGMLARCWVCRAYLGQHPTAMYLLGVGNRWSRGWVALGMQCFDTCALLPALYLRILTLLWWYWSCCARIWTLRLCLEHWLQPSLFLLFLFSRIPCVSPFTSPT